MPKTERIPLVDASRLPLIPPASISEDQAEELSNQHYVRLLGRRKVYAAQLMPGTSLASLHAFLRRKVTHKLPIAEDCHTVALIGKTFCHIHTEAWNPLERVA
ncbi:MAG: hypothetical protein ABFD89_28810 [Bryobacteraceae bacterium]